MTVISAISIALVVGAVIVILSAASEVTDAVRPAAANNHPSPG